MSRSRRMTLAVSGATLVAAVALAPPAAYAQLSGFKVDEIAPAGDFELSDRIGRTSGATEHIINIEDCEAYQGREARLQFSFTNAPGDWDWGAAYGPPGVDCELDESSNANLAGRNPDCFVAAQNQDLSGSSDAFRIDLGLLTGEACDTGRDQNATVYIVLETDGVVDEEVVVEEILFEVDLDPPAAPVLTDVTGGDRRIGVDWDDETNDPEDTSYIVYYATDPIPNEPSEEVRRKDGVNNTQTSLTSGVTNGVTHYVRVAAEDEADNIGPLSEELTVVPIETQDFWEQYLDAGGTEEGGFCFVATAAYGTPMGGDLDTLRAFRDQVLLASAPGRAFVDAYYTWGRFAAAGIAGSPALRAAARIALVPLVWFAHLTTELPPLSSMAVLMALLACLVATSRRLRERILRDVPLEVRR